MSNKPRLLMIDDNDLLRLGCRMGFERAGFEVLLAENGSAGLELARAHLPDVILLDINMPVLNGWQTVSVLTQDVRTAGVPVIAFTAERFGVSSAQLKAAGFRGYAEKGKTLQATIALVRLFLLEENRGKEWIEPVDPPPEPWRMKDAG